MPRRAAVSLERRRRVFASIQLVALPGTRQAASRVRNYVECDQHLERTSFYESRNFSLSLSFSRDPLCDCLLHLSYFTYPFSFILTFVHDSYDASVGLARHSIVLGEYRSRGISLAVTTLQSSFYMLSISRAFGKLLW